MRIPSFSYGAQQTELGQLNVIVGPNGVGKTRLLTELYHSFINNNIQPKFWNVRTSVQYSDEDYGHWRSHLVTSKNGDVDVYYSSISNAKDIFGGDGLYNKQEIDNKLVVASAPSGLDLYLARDMSYYMWWLIGKRPFSR